VFSNQHVRNLLSESALVLKPVNYLHPMWYSRVVCSKANRNRSWHLSEFLNWSLQADASTEEYTEGGFVWMKWSFRELAVSSTQVRLHYSFLFFQPLAFHLSPRPGRLRVKSKADKIELFVKASDVCHLFLTPTYFIAPFILLISSSRRQATELELKTLPLCLRIFLYLCSVSSTNHVVTQYTALTDQTHNSAHVCHQ